jgi:uncharacterized repeat protein (TIGR02543 family)
VSKNPDQPSYRYGTVVTLTATPDSTSHFVSWSGDVSSGANPLALTMDGHKSVTANFAINTYALEVTSTMGGRVVKDPDQASYEHGTTVTLSAIPDSGYRFVGWEGDASGTENPVIVTMDRKRTVNAKFADEGNPIVRVLAPNGGETLTIGTNAMLQWEAIDNGGIASVDLYLSRNGAGGPYEIVALGVAPDGSHPWTVSGPSTNQAFLMVIAHDSTGNIGVDVSDLEFAIAPDALGARGAEITQFALEPIVPNPARGMASIAYTVPREASVRLTVVDVQGRQIATLAAGVHSPGRYRVTWSPAGPRGTAGTYFVRYQAPGRDLTRRLTVRR